MAARPSLLDRLQHNGTARDARRSLRHGQHSRAGVTGSFDYGFPSPERAITLESYYADAHIALGAYHAEIVGKVGSLIGSLTYGASKDVSIGHFEKAITLNPESAILGMVFERLMLTQSGQVGKRGS